MTDGKMVYVAADPTQPGAAWAIAATAAPDDAVWRKELAKTFADWLKRGADVQLVTHSVGCEMLNKWIRLEDEAKAQKSAQGELL